MNSRGIQHVTIGSTSTALTPHRLDVGINLPDKEGSVLLEFRADAPDELDVHLAEHVQPRAVEPASPAPKACAAGQDPVDAVLRGAA